MARPQSKKKVIVRQTIIGGTAPLICIPLVAQDESRLLDQARAVVRTRPDLVEWRVDAYATVRHPVDCLSVLNPLRTILGDIPLIFTCRIEEEGGMQPVGQDTRMELITTAITSAMVDIVDIEMANAQPFIGTIRDAAVQHNVRLILSYHDFTQTPDASVIIDKLNQAETLGADIAKVAVMPNTYKDVLTLLAATLRARSETLTIPMITIAMAAEGGVTRMAGGLFGSDITFAAGSAVSAPGQIPIEELRRAMALLYLSDPPTDSSSRR